MKKSLIVSLIITLAVIGWFLSGQISVGNENLNEQPNSQNSNINNDETIYSLFSNSASNHNDEKTFTIL